MNDASDIMAPDEGVLIRGGAEKVIVKEMTWKASKDFLKSLASQAGVFLISGEGGVTGLDQNKLLGVLMQTLGDDLVVAATGQTREWVGELPFSDMTALLDKAIELNLRPEMIDGAKKVVRRLSALAGMATSRTPTTS